MATKSNVRLGGAYVEITANNGKLIDALKDSESRIQTFVNEFAKTGASLSALGLGVAAPMKKAVDTFAEFEKQMLITQAVTGATEAQLARLTKQAKDLGATTSWTAAQVAEGMVALGRMGFSNREIQGTISSVMDLGRALDTDVNQAAKELGAVMRQFQADSSQAGHYADALATATNGAAIEMDELLESMKYVGTAGNALGADVETVLALTMALRNAGVSASQAGTQLRSMFISLQAPKNLQLFADKFGVEIYDANGRLKSFIDILIEAQKRAGALGDQLLVVARQMFGKLQAPGFLALLQSPDLERFRDMLYKCDGAAEAFREGMESGVYGSLKRSLSMVERVSIDLGESLAPTVREVEDAVKDITTFIGRFIEENKPLINLIAKTALEFGSLGATMLAGAGIMKGFAGTSRLVFTGATNLALAWRKAGESAETLNAETATLETTLAKMTGTAPGEALAASLNKAASAAKEATFAVNGLESAEERLGSTFTVAGTRAPERRIDATAFSATGENLTAPASVSAAIDARAQTAQANAEARKATNDAIRQARRDATVTATAEYNAQTNAIHQSRMTAMSGGSHFSISTQAFLDQEQRATEQAYRAKMYEIDRNFTAASKESLNEAYRADLNKQLNTSYGYTPNGTVVANTKGATFSGTTTTAQGAAANGTFKPSGASFFIPQAKIANPYGLSAKGGFDVGTLNTSAAVNLDLTNDLAFDERVKTVKDSIQAAKNGIAGAQRAANEINNELRSLQAKDEQFIKDIRANNYYPVKGKEYTFDQWRAANKALKRDKEYAKRANAELAKATANQRDLERLESELARLRQSRFGMSSTANSPEYFGFDKRNLSVNGQGADNFTLTGKATEKINATAKASENAANAAYTLNDATKKVEESSGKAAPKVAAVGESAKKSSVAMQALKFAANGALGVVKMFASMAVSMFAWTAVLKVFEGIANYAHKAAEDMRKAQESNDKIFDKDKQMAEDAMAAAVSDEEKIEKLVSIAESNKTLNNVEGRQLDALYDDLNNRGIVRGWVMQDPTTPTGYRVLNAGAIDAMKGNAALYKSQELKAKGEALNVDLHMIDPARYAEGQRIDAETVKRINLSAYENAGRVIESMSKEQKRKFFGEYGWNTWGNDNRLSTRLSAYSDEVYTGSGNIGLLLSRLFNDNSRKAGADVNKKIFELLNKQLTEAGIYGDDAISLGEYILRLMGIDPETRKYLTDEIDTRALTAFVDSQGAGLPEFITQLKEFGASIKTAKELAAASEAYFADARENRDKPFNSDADAKQAEADAATAAADLATKFAEFDAALGKAEERAKSPAQRELDALEKQFKEIQEGMKGSTDQAKLDELAKLEERYTAQRVELQKQINEELEREAEQRKKEQAEYATSNFSAELGDMMKAIFSGDFAGADKIGKDLDFWLAAYRGASDVDLSKFYEESVSTIRDALERTKTTLSSVGTFNAYEAADFGRDYQLDVQKEQLAMLRSANRGLQNIYAFMQNDDAYKEYM